MSNLGMKSFNLYIDTLIRLIQRIQCTVHSLSYLTMRLSTELNISKANHFLFFEEIERSNCDSVGTFFIQLISK